MNLLTQIQRFARPEPHQSADEYAVGMLLMIKSGLCFEIGVTFGASSVGLMTYHFVADWRWKQQ
jgi:hypothetical protein